VVGRVWFFERAEEDSLYEPEHVPSAEDDAGDGEDGDGGEFRTGGGG